MMSRKEFQRLRAFSIAKKNAPWTNKIGRRHAKGRAKGVGQILKKSSLKHMSFDPLESVNSLPIAFLSTYQSDFSVNINSK